MRSIVYHQFRRNCISSKRSFVYHQADKYTHLKVWWDTTRLCRVDVIHADAWWYTKLVGLDKKIPSPKTWNFLEAPPRFELGIKVLQTSALPLGYGAIKLIENTLKVFSINVERITRLELATFTLARWRSTGWAKSANLVLPDGIEPSTRGFSVHCSTDWATEALNGDPERARTVDLQRDRLAF